MQRPTFEETVAYAVKAVKSEYDEPNHGRLSSYDHQSVMNDVLNHFVGLTTSDEDEEFIREAVHQAQQQFGEKTGIWL